eukprot:gnl/TRDRNA2_/TRDRNA2_88462_c0_seq2.p1 gnl/TRDRNA2_/TRDRNA2_88462_c0~~gnl/TRDRNA2_/TRDRNA2_88462_c0_seq2.p1  ORF type:complete len:447 (+),score=132.67 gnl/TRDRNA2_/TRDRNA2_88462_c0_seq2:130-1470(+)
MPHAHMGAFLLSLCLIGLASADDAAGVGACAAGHGSQEAVCRQVDEASLMQKETYLRSYTASEASQPDEEQDFESEAQELDEPVEKEDGGAEFRKKMKAFSRKVQGRIIKADNKAKKAEADARNNIKYAAKEFAKTKAYNLMHAFSSGYNIQIPEDEREMASFLQIFEDNVQAPEEEDTEAIPEESEQELQAKAEDGGAEFRKKFKAFSRKVQGRIVKADNKAKKAEADMRNNIKYAAKEFAKTKAYNIMHAFSSGYNIQIPEEEQASLLQEKKGMQPEEIVEGTKLMAVSQADVYESLTSTEPIDVVWSDETVVARGPVESDADGIKLLPIMPAGYSEMENFVMGAGQSLHEKHSGPREAKEKAPTESLTAKLKREKQERLKKVKGNVFMNDKEMREFVGRYDPATPMLQGIKASQQAASGDVTGAIKGLASAAMEVPIPARMGR